jgi:protein-S-isoprenylcysteine O-methyltransferase Ste14
LANLGYTGLIPDKLPAVPPLRKPDTLETAMDNRRLYSFAAIQVLAGAMLLWVSFAWPGPWSPQRCTGTLLVLAGIAGIATARYQLGKSFAIKAEARQLVTRGLYSRIRNPIYVFGVVLFVGLILIVRLPQLWIALAAIVTMQIVRARREARVLEAAFGDAYRDYRARTWF